ncbi:SDR family NAD(P)-dependent oxidoreductase [Streptomyces kaempferi]
MTVPVDCAADRSAVAAALSTALTGSAGPPPGPPGRPRRTVPQKPPESSRCSPSTRTRCPRCPPYRGGPPGPSPSSRHCRTSAPTSPCGSPRAAPSRPTRAAPRRRPSSRWSGGSDGSSPSNRPTSGAVSSTCPPPSTSGPPTGSPPYWLPRPRGPGRDPRHRRPRPPSAARGHRRPAVRRRWHPDGTVLVTGGTGALGRHVARWLARSGARDLLLVSRSGPDAPGAAEFAAELAALGARADIARCDLADPGDLARLLAAIPDERPLTAVFHTAAVLDDGVIGSLTPERLADVLRVKVGGALNLDSATAAST